MTFQEQTLPKYKCHKTVRALRIKSIEQPTGKHLGKIIPYGDRFNPVLVNQSFINKHNPQPGGYFVVYQDGYWSYSPQDAFEAGYSLVEE